MATETALLLFSRTAASEAANKALVPAKNSKTNIKAASLLVENSRKVANSSGLPMFELNEHKQVGDGFGERLTNALEQVFDAGFENVIVIGSDCPQLTVAIINTATTQLAKQQLVLGPDSRGGVYLIGVSRKLFHIDSFLSVDWQTSNPFQNLQEIFRETTLYTLPVLKDVNNFTDLVSLKDILPRIQPIKAFVISMLASLYRVYFRLYYSYNTVIFSSFGLRAPPNCF